MRIWPSSSLADIHPRINRNKSSSVPSRAVKHSSPSSTSTVASVAVTSPPALPQARVFLPRSTTPARHANIRHLSPPSAPSNYVTAHSAMARSSQTSLSLAAAPLVELVPAVVAVLLASLEESDKLNEMGGILYDKGLY